MAKSVPDSRNTGSEPSLSLIEWYECDSEALLEILENGEVTSKVLEVPSPSSHLYPIQYAVIKNDYDLCIALIDAGCNLDVVTAIEGRNLLHLAARYNASPEIRNELIRAGVYLYARDEYGDTPLAIASAFKMQNFLKYWDETIPVLIAERVKFCAEQYQIETTLFTSSELLQIAVEPDFNNATKVPSVCCADSYGVVNGTVSDLDEAG